MQTYDPKDVIVVVKAKQIDGFAPGTFIKVSRNEDAFTFQPSNSGGGARSRNPNKSGTVEITLLNSAPSNATLSAQALADELSASGVGEFLVKDRRTDGAQCQAQNMWIKKVPDWERAKELGETTWTFETDDLNITHAGLVDA